MNTERNRRVIYEAQIKALRAASDRLTQEKAELVIHVSALQAEVRAARVSVEVLAGEVLRLRNIIEEGGLKL